MQTVVAEAIGSLERFGPTWWQSPESAVLADLELKRGIDRFAGKAGIAVFGCQRTDGSDAAGAANCWCCCGRSSGCGVWFASVPLLERTPCKPSYGQRFCDRLTTAKQTSATGRPIRGAKVSEAQCLQGFAAETWRDSAHGRQQNWAFGGTAEAGDWRRAEMAGSGAAGARGAERAQLARASKRWRRLPAAAWSSSTELGAAARQARSWRNRGSFTELARWAAICPGGMVGDFGESWRAGAAGLAAFGETSMLAGVCGGRGTIWRGGGAFKKQQLQGFVRLNGVSWGVVAPIGHKGWSCSCSCCSLVLCEARPPKSPPADDQSPPAD
jgi:hypothetical protein